MEIIIKNKNYSATINSLGAELVALNMDAKNYIWTKDVKYWNKYSPVLFPIVGTLNKNAYVHNDKEYILPRHGFARDFEFEMIHKTENSVTFCLSENADSLLMYPFNFELQINYTLIGHKLHISYQVENCSNETMPFSIGAHPAFGLDLDIENYSLQFPLDDELVTHCLENGLFNGEIKTIKLQKNKLPLTYLLFEKDAIVVKKLKSTSVIIEKNNAPEIQIDLGSFLNLGIWTVKNAPFICIEPWRGYTSILNSSSNLFTKEGIETLEPNKKFNIDFSVILLS
jgi:galactose mutarotase-like enzyme